MKRGEVWWVNLPAPMGRRPVLLLSRDTAYQTRDLAIASPITTRIRDIPTEVRLGPEDGLPRLCVANLDTIMTIPLSTLQQRITGISSQKLQAVDAAIRYALGMAT